MKLAQIPTYIDPTGASPAQLSDLEATLGNLIAAFLSFAGIVVFIMLLVGGFKYITSSGNPQSAESAKGTITFAIGGLLLVALSYIILRLIGEFTGVGDALVNFTVLVPSP